MKVALPKLPQLKPRERLLATGSAVILLMVVLDRLVLTPWLRHAQTVRQEIHRMEQSLNHYSRLLSRRDYVLAQRERYQRYLRSPLPDELQMAGLLKEIEGLAERSRIHLAEVKPLPQEGDETTRRYSLDVQFDCTLEEWVDFIIEVEASPSLFQIVRSTLATQEDAPDRLKGSLRVVSVALRPKPEGHADAGARRYAAAR
jgi:Tfp pilus assembly protein PilO